MLVEKRLSLRTHERPSSAQQTSRVSQYVMQQLGNNIAPHVQTPFVTSQTSLELRMQAEGLQLHLYWRCYDNVHSPCWHQKTEGST